MTILSLYEQPGEIKLWNNSHQQKRTWKYYW